VLAAIATGGFLGTLARYGVELAWSPSAGGFPWATFVINTSGAFLLGVILTVLLERFRRDRFVRPLVCVGVLGSWTTMSSLAVESDLLVRHGQAVVALGYLAATVVAGLGVTWMGIGVGRSLATGRMQWSWP
jgi:CrcB protein